MQRRGRRQQERNCNTEEKEGRGQGWRKGRREYGGKREVRGEEMK